MEIETDQNPFDTDEGTLTSCIIKLTGVRECTKQNVIASANGSFETNGPVELFTEVILFEILGLSDLTKSVINWKVQNVTIVFTDPGL